MHATCPAALEQRRQAADQRRGTSTDRGYDASWRVVRVRALERDGFTCQRCGWQPDQVRMASEFDQDVPTFSALASLKISKRFGDRHLHVDHIQPIEDRPDLRLELSNLQTLCNTCHAAKTMIESVRQ